MNDTEKRLTLPYAAALLALCLLPPLVSAKEPQQQQATQQSPRIDCYRRCDANNKKCSDEGKIPAATCSSAKQVCYGVCNDVNPR